MRLAVGLAWIILVPAEMLGVDSGLGYFILDARDRLAYSELMAAIIAIGICGFLIDGLTRWALRERRADPGVRVTRAMASPEQVARSERAIDGQLAALGGSGDTWRPASEDKAS